MFTSLWCVAGMALLTVIMVLMNDYCSTAPVRTCPGLPLSVANYLQLLVSLETVVALLVLILYLGTSRLSITRAQ